MATATRIFVFTNHKGGVGKSTSATNTAFGMVQLLRRAGTANPRVLLIDTDSQSHATLVTTGRKNFGANDSLYSVLVAERQHAAQTLADSIVASTWDPDLHVLPASAMLEGAERELMGVPLLWTAPPNLAPFPLSVTPSSVRLPTFWIAPPLPPPALKFRMVTFCSVSDPLIVTLNARNCDPPLRSKIAPLPTIVIGVVTDGSAMLLLALVNVYVLFDRQIVSADAPFSFAALIALTSAVGFAAVTVQVTEGVGVDVAVGVSVGVGVAVNVGVKVEIGVKVGVGGSVGEEV